MSRSRFLKAVAELPKSPRLMLDGPLDEQDLERKFEQLHERALRIESNRLQVLLLAGSAGFLSMVAFVTTFRGCSKQGRRDGSMGLYGQIPTESPSQLERKQPLTQVLT